MKNQKIAVIKKRVTAYDKAQEEWGQRKLIDVNSLPFDEVCADLIVKNSDNKKVNEVMRIRIFNNQESLNIGCLFIPNQFKELDTQEQFIVNIESIRDHFDSLLLMSTDSNFIDFGFKKILTNGENNGLTHYRNCCFDFDSFKDVFKSKSIVIMRTSIASGSNKAMQAITSTFAFPNFLSNQIVEIRNTIVCINSGVSKCTNEELNEISKYSHSHIKRGMSLIQSTFEDLSLGNDIKVSALISCFDTIK